MSPARRDGWRGERRIGAPTALPVGIVEIDRQNQELATRTGRLLDGIVGGDPFEVHRVIEFLHTHIAHHLGLEERLMAETSYPGLAAHQAEHDAFTREHVHFSVELERKGASALVAMRVSNWLATWLRRHVAVSDGTLGRFLLEVPAGPPAGAEWQGTAIEALREAHALRGAARQGVQADQDP